MIELIKQEPRDDGRDMIIPFSVTLKDGCLTVECEEGLVETAQEYERRFSEQPFSEEARRFVADAVEAETAGQKDENGVTFSHFPKDFVMERMKKMGVLKQMPPKTP